MPVKQFIAGALINGALNGNDAIVFARLVTSLGNNEVVLQNFASLSCLRLLALTPEVETSKDKWTLKLERKKAILEPNQISFSFESDDAMRYHLARAIAVCYYGVNIGSSGVGAQVDSNEASSISWAKVSPSPTEEEKAGNTHSKSQKPPPSSRKSAIGRQRKRNNPRADFTNEFSLSQLQSVCHYKSFGDSEIAVLCDSLLSYLRVRFNVVCHCLLM